MPSAGADAGSFELIKWYIDVVDQQGRSAIGYWTSLRWGPLALRWEALSLHQPGREAQHRSGRGAAESPGRVGGTDLDGRAGEIAWNSRTLGCEVRCRPWSAAHHATLLHNDAGQVNWTCESPAATVSFSVSAARGAGEPPMLVVGDGYAEQLTLTLAPWKLPISELRWGRWSCSSSRRSLVWIDWRGASPLTLVLDNGAPTADARVEDDHVRIDGRDLVLTGTRTLHARRLGDMALGGVAATLSPSWRALEDRKWLSRGMLGGETGWAIHETVRFP